jgi:putative ABC transport system substrate-binding protein
LAADIAILKSADVDYYDQAVQGVRSTFPTGLTIKEYSLHGSPAEGRVIGKALRASPPDVVIAVGLKAALAAKLELVDVPVIFCLVLDPELYNLPAKNMIGIQMRLAPDVQLASLRSVLPNVKRLGLLYDEDKTGGFVKEAQAHAARLQLELVALPIHSRDDVPTALKSLLGKIDALWVTQDQTVVTTSTIPLLIQATLSAKVPLFTFSSTLVQQGAFGALVVDAWTVGQQAGHAASAILRGESMPGGRVLSPERPQLALNLRSAELLALSPPPEVIRFAGQLYSGTGPVAGQLLSAGVIP